MKNWGVLFMVGAAFSLSAGEGVLRNQVLTATYQAESRRVSLSKRGEKKPFAEFLLPLGKTEVEKDEIRVTAENHSLTLRAREKSPFFEIRVAPVPGGAPVIKTLALPEFALPCPVPLNRMKSLGTAGLKGATDHPGSYMFLSVVEPESRSGVVAAWVTSRKASGIVFSRKGRGDREVLVRAEAQYGRYRLPEKLDEDEGERFVIGAFDDCRLGLEAYADEIVRTFNIRLNPQIAGYCTWYSDRNRGAGNERSTAEFVEKAKELLQPYGYTYFQIDDGWQLGGVSSGRQNGPRKNFTGHNPKGPYPSGMRLTADRIRERGFIPGIWFMPFSGTHNDPFYADKQDWFVKSAVDYPPERKSWPRYYSGIAQRKGAPYETFWGGTSLDMTHPEVAAFMTEEVSRISHEWGYKFFKYDGMWTGMGCRILYVNDGYRPDDIGLQLFHDPHATPVEAFRRGLQRVRDAAGKDVFILGCNVSQNMRTMGAAYGMVDAMRIGPDNGWRWKDLCRGPYRGTARYFYNGKVWYNDPDPVYVRNAMPLSHAQLIASWVAVSGQLFAFSDWLPSLSPERVNILQRTLAPCPWVDSRRPEDLFESSMARLWQVKRGECRVFGFFNWDEKRERTVGMAFDRLGLDPSATYAGYDFWGERYLPSIREKLEMTLPGGSCCVLALRRMENAPFVISTSRHVLSPIFDISGERWCPEKRELTGLANGVARQPYVIRIALPRGASLLKAEMEGAQKVEAREREGLVELCGQPVSSGKLRWRVTLK